MCLLFNKCFLKAQRCITFKLEPLVSLECHPLLPFTPCLIFPTSFRKKKTSVLNSLSWPQFSIELCAAWNVTDIKRTLCLIVRYTFVHSTATSYFVLQGATLLSQTDREKSGSFLMSCLPHLSFICGLVRLCLTIVWLSMFVAHSQLSHLVHASLNFNNPTAVSPEMANSSCFSL